MSESGKALILSFIGVDGKNVSIAKDDLNFFFG